MSALWNSSGSRRQLKDSVHQTGSSSEFFSQVVETVDGATGKGLSSRLFTTRLELIGTLDDPSAARTETDAALRVDVAALLHADVAAMNTNNFLVRRHRRLVETYARLEAWTTLDDDTRHQLAECLASLPTERTPERLEAKQFDLLVLGLQLCILGAATNLTKLRKNMVEIAAALEEQTTIPVVMAQMALIQEVQTDAWWEDVTAGLLEVMRKRLRGLVHLIDKRRRPTIYTDFEDEIGEGVTVEFDSLRLPDNFEKFRAKMRHFLLAHEEHVTIHKLRTNHQLTPTDLEELERMLRESGIGTDEDIERAKAQAAGLGLFVRSLVGLDRAAAKEAFATFMTGRTLTGNQIEFLDLIISHLTESGIMKAARLYESPYTDLSPTGVDGLFGPQVADELFVILNEISRRAAA